MACTGRKFKQLAGVESLIISDHALARLAECLGQAQTPGQARDRFDAARQVKADDMRLLGYSPNYSKRMKQGIQSWYFLMMIKQIECVAVIQSTETQGEYVWVTTYGKTAQTGHCRVLAPERLLSA